MTGVLRFISYVFLGLFVLLPSLDGAARFIRFPPTRLYVVKGQTARFIWEYHVDDRNQEFTSISPKWAYYNKSINDEYKRIGGDVKSIGWKFIIDKVNCPSRLLIPTVRVSRESQATLVITNVTTADNGVYECSLNLFSVHQDSLTVRSSKLIVTETPRFTSAPNPVTIVTEQSNIDINCTAVGPPTPEIKWVRVQGVTNVTMVWGFGSAVLSLRNISRNSSGKYECQAANNPNQSPVTAATMITVYYKPTMDKKTSSINIASWNGNEITLRCKYSSSVPVPTWIWYRPNGDFVTAYIRSIHDGSEVTVMTGQDSSDYGLYKCEAANVMGTDQHSINVTRLFPPSIPRYLDIVGVHSSSAVVSWTRPVNNGGSPVTGYKLLVNSTTIYVNTSHFVHHHEITGLLDDTVYEVKVLSRNIVGYGGASSKVFRTSKQAVSAKSPSPTRDTSNDATRTAVLASFLAVSLLANLMFAVYTIWSRDTCSTKQHRASSVYENQSVQMTSQTIPVSDNQHACAAITDVNTGRPSIKLAVSNPPVEYANLPGNQGKIKTSQDIYQQLNPATLQQDTTGQYEPLRTRNVPSRSDLRNDTYEPLRNRPTEYQSLQRKSNVNTVSFS